MEVSGKRLYFDTREEAQENMRKGEVIYYSKPVRKYYFKLPRIGIFKSYIKWVLGW